MTPFAQRKVNVTVCFWNCSSKKVVTVKYKDYLRGLRQVLCFVNDLDRKVPHYLPIWRVRNLANTSALALHFFPVLPAYNDVKHRKGLELLKES